VGRAAPRRWGAGAASTGWPVEVWPETRIDTIVRARSGSRGLSGSLAAAALLALAAACSSSSSGSSSDGGGSTPPPDGGIAGKTCQYTVLSQAAPAATCASPGAAITGADNGHCVVGGVQQVQATGMCQAVGSDAGSSSDDTSDADVPALDASATGDSATAEDAGDDADNGECDEPGYGVTNYGTSAADDDCKYDVSWTSTPICGNNANVYFTVTAKQRAGADGGASLSDEPPLLGASVDAEVYADDCATIAMNSGQTTVELGNGAYKVGPIEFSKSGKWIVRFHFNECCSDDPADSPHGHAAFWVMVP
jgi:hypothetical protein